MRLFEVTSVSILCSPQRRRQYKIKERNTVQLLADLQIISRNIFLSERTKKLHQYHNDLMQKEKDNPGCGQVIFPQKNLAETKLFSQKWWRWGDSNPWPRKCESRALPAELHPHEVIELFKLAEKVGFEPTCPGGQPHFECGSLWPLRYFSKRSLSIL